MRSSQDDKQNSIYSEKDIFFISGSSQGIGKELVIYLLAKGATVLGCSRSATDVDHPHYHHYILDLADSCAIKQTVADIKKDFKYVSVLVNNAGMSDTNYINLLNSDSIEKSFQVNTIGSINLTKEFIRLMRKKQNGRIINISSMHVPLCSPGTSIYGATKAALEQFGQVASRELNFYGITVNSLSLSVVEDLGMANELTEEAKNAILIKTITSRPIKVEEIGHAIDFLSAEKSACITGQTIYLGGI